jgi:hypothetical protein
VFQTVASALGRAAFELRGKQLLPTVSTHLEATLASGLPIPATMAALVLGLMLELDSVLALAVPAVLQ